MLKRLMGIDPETSARHYLSTIRVTLGELEECLDRLEKDYITLGMHTPAATIWVLTEKDKELYKESEEFRENYNLLNAFMKDPKIIRETPLKKIEEIINYSLFRPKRVETILKEYKLSLLPDNMCFC